MTEIWAQIQGYEGYYEVSNQGRVRSMERYVDRVKQGRLQRLLRKSIPLKERTNYKGYREVTLQRNGERMHFRVHRLVANAFCHNGPQEHVNHINAVRDDNRAENLEWCTAKHNVAHAIANDPKNWGRKAIVGIKDGEAVYFFDSAADAGRAGFNKGNISSALCGRCRTSGGYEWQFAVDYFSDLV